MSKRAVRVYLHFHNPAQARRTGQILRAACENKDPVKHIDVELEEVSADADILVTDILGAFEGIEPKNNQLFVIAHKHGHSLPEHYRTVEPDLPVRRLIKIVREKDRELQKAPFSSVHDREIVKTE